MLILRLDGVLQSWGLRARWDFRDTGRMPSKSGVMGLIACCMGLKRNDKQIHRLDDELIMGVREDRPGVLLQDYHTVTGDKGYLFSSEEKKRVGEPTIITPREYLQDACFTVALQGNSELLKKCAEALMNPVWQIYLGRKSCPPSRPIFEKLTDEYSSLEQALKHYPLCDRPLDSNFFYCEIEDDNGNIIRQDRIVNSGYKYLKRRVRWLSIEYMGVK